MLVVGTLLIGAGAFMYLQHKKKQQQADSGGSGNTKTRINPVAVAHNGIDLFNSVANLFKSKPKQNYAMQSSANPAPQTFNVNQPWQNLSGPL